MSDGKQLELLLKSLKSHEISFNQKNLKRALEIQSDPTTEAWIDKYLRPATLLTEEELSLYSALEKSGESEVLTLSQHLSFGRSVCDDDIKKAVDELQSSTIKIERQTETLRTQQEAIEVLVKSNRENYAARVTADSARSRAWTTKYNQNRSAVDEVLQNLKYQIAELSDAGRVAEIGLRKTASEILKLDDKILLGLQELASDLDLEYHTEDVIAHRVRDLCARLIKYNVEVIRTRLDRIYLEATVDREGISERSKAPENEEVVALFDELESLYTEILPVTQISVEQQYLEPALHLIAVRSSHGGDKSTKAIDYISRCLLDLAGRLQGLAVHAEEYNSYRGATILIASVIKSEDDIDQSLSPKARLPNNPTRLRKPNKPISPVRPRNTRRRSSATSFDDDANPELQILRTLGISLPTESTNELSIAATLQDIIGDQEMKFNGHMRSLEEVSEASIGSHLHDSQITLQLLVEPLLCDMPYPGMNPLDKEVQEALVRLEKGVEKVKKEITAVNLDSLAERNIRRDNLIERWAP